MLGSVLRALQHTLRALMRLLTQRGEAGPADASRSAASAGEARGATLDDGSGWFIPYEDPLVFPSATLKSAESRHSLYLRFMNLTPEPVRIHWIDYAGSPVRYKTIEAGRSHRQQSFLSHPWTAVAAAGGGVRLVLNGQPAIFPLADSEAPASVVAEAHAAAAEGMGSDAGTPDALREVMTVRIERPPPLAWSIAVHARFPRCFRDAARTVLLAHARLAAEAAGASPHSSPRAAEEARATLGSLPVHLRDEILALAAPQLPHYLPVRMPRPSTPDLT